MFLSVNTGKAFGSELHFHIGLQGYCLEVRSNTHLRWQVSLTVSVVTNAVKCLMLAEWAVANLNDVIWGRMCMNSFTKFVEYVDKAVRNGLCVRWSLETKRKAG